MASAAAVQRVDGQLPPEAAPAQALTCLRLTGPLTAGTTAGTRAALRASARNSHFRLLVDLHDVTALDATGVAALLQAQRAVRRREHGMLVLRPNRIVSDALRHSRTISAFVLWNG
ncbi:MAG TPA: STAS domain-containing protein [Methylomirabilota bacterium]|jgi:anti-anti-sigma factor|nr:STAS domain-containing protein [Methylomirabilota bacterium]